MNYKEQIRSVKDYIRLPFCYTHWYVAGLVEEFGQEPVAKTLLPNRKLHAYPVKEVGPFAFIWMGNPEQPDWDRFPDLSFLEDSRYRTIYDATPYAGSYLLMQENLNDLTHFSYLHKDSFSIGDYFLDLPTTVEKTEQGVYCNRIDTDPARALAPLPEDVKERAEGKPVESHDGGYAMSPGVFRGYAPVFIGSEDDPDREVLDNFVMHYLTPETKTSSHYYWSITNIFNIGDDEFYAGSKAFAAIGFAEDKWACEEMQQLLNNDHIEYKEMVIAGDKAGMLFQGVMLDWVLEE